VAKMKQTKKYYFSVEGETEQWYLLWLRDQINACDDAKYKVAIEPKVEKSPLKYIKKLTITGKTEVYHLSDYESDEQMHEAEFIQTMDELKAAKESGKNVSYKFGYSNLTFDLWMILHKINCSGSKTHRSQYLEAINRAYGENFESMKKYKEEENFKRILGKLSLDDVKDAIQRSKRIMAERETAGHRILQYKGYRYYKENPSLMVWEAIEKILVEIGLI